jgi:KUP system potassium uptake protein
VQIKAVPLKEETERASVTRLEQGLYQVVVRFGFMEEPDVPRVLEGLSVPGLFSDVQRAPYFVNRTRVIPTGLPGMALWREQLYRVMRHNTASAADFFRLPPSRVFEISTSVEV